MGRTITPPDPKRWHDEKYRAEYRQYLVSNSKSSDYYSVIIGLIILFVIIEISVFFFGN